MSTDLKYPKKIRIVEVGPRDGLQNEKQIIPTHIKVDLINRLSESGLQTIEVGAFVSPKWVPQMADTAEVFQSINKRNGVSYPVLVPNIKGLESALEVGVKEIAIFGAASESFSQKNINCSISESVERFKPVCDRALKEGLKIRGYVSCVMGCPYEGEVSPEQVANISEQLYQLGCYEVSLGDTIGIGTPEKTRKMVQAVKAIVPADSLAVHFHDTYERALDNLKIAMEEGISVIDSAVAGLGGCPYADGASGNVATESVLKMLSDVDIDTGVDLGIVLDAGQFIRSALKQTIG